MKLFTTLKEIEPFDKGFIDLDSQWASELLSLNPGFVENKDVQYRKYMYPTRHWELAIDDSVVAIGSIADCAEEHCIEITKLYVPLEHRDKGYAKMILFKMEEYALNKKHERIFLNTSNIRPDFEEELLKAGYQVVPFDVKIDVESPVILMEKLL